MPRNRRRNRQKHYFNKSGDNDNTNGQNFSQDSDFGNFTNAETLEKIPKRPRFYGENGSPEPNFEGEASGMHFKNRRMQKKFERSQRNDDENWDDRKKLKGKALGMYYRNKQKQKNQEELCRAVKLSISERYKNEIQEIIENVNIESASSSVDPKNKYDHITESTFKTNFLKTISITFEEKLNNIVKETYLPGNSELDIELKYELETKETFDERYKEMLKFRQKLPAYKCKDTIIKMLAENQIIVISGETGCGKTTQVAQFILDDYIANGCGSKCKVVCTQPRRISAVSVAERVADEKNESVGQGYAGYQIRLEKKLPRESGSILFCTTGVLLTQMQSNPALVGISHLILDEIHERCVESDILLTLMKDVIVKRKDLKIILMSATLNAEKFSKYYNGAPHINIPGFTYPVEEYFLEDVLQMINFRFPPPGIVDCTVYCNYTSTHKGVAYLYKFEKTNYMAKGLLFLFLYYHIYFCLSNFDKILQKNSEFNYSAKKISCWDLLNEASAKQLGWTKHLKKNKQKFQANDAYSSFIEPYARQLEHEGVYSRKVIDDLRNPESERLNVELIRELIIHINKTKPEGAILVFLPGLVDIAALQRLLQESPHIPKTDLIIPLHSKLETTQQKTIFQRPPSGVRKIILATNIAETSITIDDVVYVIDSGKIKLTRLDVDLDIETLKAEFVSLANASQRKGRAGRVQPGICYHLYSKARHMSLDAYQDPEIIRIRLDEVILKLKILQIGKVEPFFDRTLDKPFKTVIETSLRLLKRLNALDDEELLTPLGYHLANLPMDPRSGKMILLAAMFSCIDPIFSIAASLSFKDAFYSPIGKDNEVLEKKSELSNGSKSDHLLFANAFEQWENMSNWREAKNFCYEYFLNHNTLVLLKDMKQQFADHLYEMNFLPSANVKDHRSNINSRNTSLLRAIICAGLYPNVAVIRRCEVVKRRRKIDIRTPEDGRVTLFPVTINSIEVDFPSRFLVYHLKLKSSSIYLHDSTMVHPFPLLFFCDKIETDLNKVHEASSSEVILKISEIIKFKCHLRDLSLITDLRNKLNSLFEYKVAHPGFINWNDSNDETKILQAMMRLITLEDTGVLES